MRARRGVLAGALLLAASLLGPMSYADTAGDRAGDTSRAAQPAPRVDRAAKPLVRIGEVLQPSPTQRYRFRGRKGQRVVVQPDAGPGTGHGCLYDNQVRRAGVLLTTGPIGEWRLPRTGTYELRVGRTCVVRMPLRLRRYERPVGRVGSTLPTTFTRTLMRSVRLTLPRTDPVVFGREGADDFVLVTNTSARSRFEGCVTYILTAGLPWSCGPGRTSRDVVVSAPAPTDVSRATVVDAVVDGPAVTVEDPARTLVRVEVPRRTALRVESNAVPVPHTLAERDWIELFDERGRWWSGWVNTYRTPVAEGTWVPSGWTVPKAGAYLFQVVDQAAVPAGQPLTIAVRTSAYPPPGELHIPQYPD